MSQVFEGYEREYCQLLAILAQNCTSAGLLLGEQRKQNMSELIVGLEDADALIRKMDVEARTLQPNAKSKVLGRIRDYKFDLNNLKSEVKRLSFVDQSAQDALLESGMADALMDSADQRGRFLMSTDRINESSRTMQETEVWGVNTLQDLHQQRQPLLHAHNTVNGGSSLDF